MGNKKRNLKFILEGDLKNYLEELGALSELESNKAKCFYCGRKVKFKEINGIFPYESLVSYICKNPKCLKAHYDRGNY